MLESMVAMPAADLIVAALWVGGLTLFLLGQAFAGWLKLRYARRSARHASRLFEATQAASVRRSRGSPQDLLPRGAGGQSPQSGA
ncbi:MAG TPA: hypothetical protein VGR13_09590 [Actinomycetota bacterium]|nr:hypothetical protein [Actinomycetota bacterium]